MIWMQVLLQTLLCEQNNHLYWEDKIHQLESPAGLRPSHEVTPTAWRGSRGRRSKSADTHASPRPHAEPVQRIGLKLDPQ